MVRLSVSDWFILIGLAAVPIEPVVAASVRFPVEIESVSVAFRISPPAAVIDVVPFALFIWPLITTPPFDETVILPPSSSPEKPIAISLSARNEW